MEEQLQQARDAVWLMFWLLMLAIGIGWRNEEKKTKAEPRDGDRHDGANR